MPTIVDFSASLLRPSQTAALVDVLVTQQQIWSASGFLNTLTTPTTVTTVASSSGNHRVSAAKLGSRTERVADQAEWYFGLSSTFARRPRGVH